MLIDTIKADQLQARKDRKTAEATVLTTLLGEAAMIGKNDGNRATTDDEVIAVVKKFIKGNNDIMGLTDPMSATHMTARDENVYVSQYLPPQLTESELNTTIQGIIHLTGAQTMKDMGTVMKELKNQFDGTYDGKTASQLIKELLK